MDGPQFTTAGNPEEKRIWSVPIYPVIRKGGETGGLYFRRWFGPFRINAEGRDIGGTDSTTTTSSQLLGEQPIYHEWGNSPTEILLVSHWFSWQGSQWRYKSIAKCPGNITIKDINGVPHIHQCSEVDKAEETLGVLIVPDENRKQQIEKMATVARSWVEKLSAGNLSKIEMWTALTSMVWQTLMYPLAALNLMKKDCEAIMAPLLNFVLPRLGICRHYPHSLVFALKSFFWSRL
jgi:hypothetical protein